MSTPIDKVAGIGPATASLLQHHGIHSAEDLAAQRLGDLAAIKGFNTLRAGLVIDAAKQLTGAAVSDSPVPAAKPDKKDKDKKGKDKKGKNKKEQTKKSSKSEKKKSPKVKKKSSSKKDKAKKKGKNKK